MQHRGATPRTLVGMSDTDARESSPMALLGGFVGTSVLAGALVAGMAIPAAGALGSTTESFAEVFNSLPSELDAGNLPSKTTILYADGTKMADIFDQNRVEVPLDAISPNMQKAVLAVEDSRFFEHNGVDPQGILRVLTAKFGGGGVDGGASTLTQQWVKNVLLYRAEKAGDAEAIRALQTEDYSRKVREVRLALAAEKEYEKHEILQNYLNIANFSDGTYGAEAAAQYYFSKSAKDLTVPESALLAGIVQRPTLYNPIKNPEHALGRRNTVLGRMLETGMITQAEYDEARALTIEEMLKVQPFSNGCAQAGGAAYFCDYVTKVLRQDPAFNYTDADGVQQRGSDLLFRGGLTITTTLDKRMQDVAAPLMMETVPVANTDPDIGMSLVSVEPGTGQIKAMAQNRIYDPSQGNTNPERTAINFNTSQDYGGSRGWQPGSNMKPIILAEWLKSGHTMDEVVRAEGRVQLPERNFTRCGAPVQTSNVWDVRNANGKDMGLITIDKATYLSVNPAYAHMTEQLDLCNVVKTAESLGIYRASPFPKPLNFQTPMQIQALPSMVLGTDEVAPITMAAAYATFAAEGRYCKPIAIANMTDRWGNEVPIPQPDCTQALPPHIPAQMIQTMSKVFTVGTAARTGPLAGGREAAGKTGTANQSTNVWFTGFTPDLSTSVWMGHVSKSQSLNRKTINGTWRRSMYGGTLPAPTWKKFMDAAHEGLPMRKFSRNTEIDELTAQEMGDQQVPRVYGKSVADATATLEAQGYIVKVGRDIYSDAPVGAVAGTSPGAGRYVSKGRVVMLLISMGPKPEPTPTETETEEPSETPTGEPTATPTGRPTTEPAIPLPETPAATGRGARTVVPGDGRTTITLGSVDSTEDTDGVVVDDAADAEGED